MEQPLADLLPGGRIGSVVAGEILAGTGAALDLALGLEPGLAELGQGLAAQHRREEDEEAERRPLPDVADHHCRARPPLVVHPGELLKAEGPRADELAAMLRAAGYNGD